MAQSATTAQILGKFRKELIAEDVPDELADEIVRDTASDLVRADRVAVKA